MAPRITKRLAEIEQAIDQGTEPVRRRALFIGIFLSSVYGGYFGAGLGIVLLAVMALTLPYEIYVLQGLRSGLSMLINAVDAVYMLLIGTLVGGWLGTLLIRRVSPKVVRTLVIIVGTVTTIKLAIGS
jgi:hypothetical protein